MNAKTRHYTCLQRPPTCSLLTFDVSSLNLAYALAVFLTNKLELAAVSEETSFPPALFLPFLTLLRQRPAKPTPAATEKKLFWVLIVKCLFRSRRRQRLRVLQFEPPARVKGCGTPTERNVADDYASPGHKVSGLVVIDMKE